MPYALVKEALSHPRRFVLGSTFVHVSALPLFYVKGEKKGHTLRCFVLHYQAITEIQSKLAITNCQQSHPTL